MSEIKILVVEDEMLVAADIEESLEILGYKVIDSVATGNDAIQSVKNQLPDVILMDIMLKGDMTGIETANIIRKDYDVPVIYLTANADISTIEKAKISLPYGYIIKPFTDKDLQTNIEIARFKFVSDLKTQMESDQYNRFFHMDENGEKKPVFVDSDKGLEKINAGDIYFIEMEKNKLSFHLLNEDISTTKSIDEVEKLLPSGQFVRVNERHIINVEKIFTFQFPEIIIADIMNVIIVDDDKKPLLETVLNTK